MKGFYSLLGAAYMVTTSFYLSPKKAIEKNEISTKKLKD
jgi:hypothetical protein